MLKESSKISFDIGNNETVLTDQLSIKPLKIVNPKSQNGTGVCMLTNYGGGFVEGDDVKLEVICKSGTKSIISSQANTRVYESDNLECKQEINIELEEDSFHTFFNDPLVMHNGANFNQKNIFHTKNNSTLLFIDWFSAGRSENGENFDFNSFETSTKAFHNKELLLWDNFKITPNEINVNSPGAFGNHTSFLNIFLIGNKNLNKVQIMESSLFSIETNENIKHNTTRINDNTLVSRFSAKKTTSLKKIIAKISNTLSHKDLLNYDPLERKY